MNVPANTLCQVCGRADATVNVCGGCAAMAREQNQPRGQEEQQPRDQPRVEPCSFCQSTEYRAVFVAGAPDGSGPPGISLRICDECLNLCCEIVAERRAEAASQALAGQQATVQTAPPEGAAQPGAAQGTSPSPSVTIPVFSQAFPSSPVPGSMPGGATILDPQGIEEALVYQTLEIPQLGTTQAPPVGKTLLGFPVAVPQGERWLRLKTTTECPACHKERPVSSLVPCCATCMAKALAPVETPRPRTPLVLAAPTPTLPPPPPNSLACGFCNKPRSLVRGLVSGPSAFICESCIQDFAVTLEPHYFWYWERPSP